MKPAANTTSSMVTATSESMLHEILAAIKALDEAEPFFRFMAEHDKSPHDGWTLFVPKSIADAAGRLPRYVRAHQFGDSFGLVAVNTRELARQGWPSLADDDLAMMGSRL